MAYVTKALVRSATGMTVSANISDTTIDTKIAYAQAVIDSKIGDVYALPLASVPDIIKFLALEITAATLYMDEYGEETENLDKGWEKRLKWAMAVLDDIQSLKMKLYGTDGVELARSSNKLPSFYPTNVAEESGDAPRLFSMNDEF